ncbi:unnamed protein product [Microthlaspi erraticum]|uniref:Apple domain-containing protein n=1 Tax=Microthlaspi erraticum TaxID=1685480 RepID=A0A6D2K420_9BRAS|nr:unnamed protein product [Microthlaspi erraticum]
MFREGIIWESFEHPGDTMLPYSSLMYNLDTSKNRVLTCWKSDTDPSPGDFVLQITPQVPSQAITMRGSTPYWRSGPWAKTRFTGIPQWMKHIQVHSALSRTQTASPKCKCFKGFVPRDVEKWKRGNWTDGCVRRTELHCQGNSTGKDANVFHAVANIKPPDFYEFVASSGNAEDCYRGCLQNCSCLAFAYIRGIGCLIWKQELMDVMQVSKGGEILSIRLARSELGGNERNKTIAASVVSLSLFVILGFGCVWFLEIQSET